MRDAKGFHTYTDMGLFQNGIEYLQSGMTLQTLMLFCFFPQTLYIDVWCFSWQFLRQVQYFLPIELRTRTGCASCGKVLPSGVVYTQEKYKTLVDKYDRLKMSTSGNDSSSMETRNLTRTKSQMFSMSLQSSSKPGPENLLTVVDKDEHRL